MSIITTNISIGGLTDTRELEKKLSKNKELIDFVINGQTLEATFDTNLYSEVYMVKMIYMDVIHEMWMQNSTAQSELRMQIVKLQNS